MRRDAGFTLLELLVAMTLLALLTVVLLGGLRFGAHAWQRSDATGSGNDEVQRIRTLVASQLAQAYPAYLPGETPGSGHVDFSGTAGRVVFLAPPPRAFGSVGRARIRLERRPDGALWQLVMVIRPELAMPGQPATTEPLLTHLSDVRFSYSGGSQDWRTAWSGTLPGLVRLDVAFPPGDARRWPALVVVPRITADVDCVYDTSTKSCQVR